MVSEENMSKSRKKSSKKLNRDSLKNNYYRDFSQNPPQLELWMNQAEKQFKIGNYQKAIALFDKIINPKKHTRKAAEVYIKQSVTLTITKQE